MIEVQITVNREIEVVWNYFIEPKNWQSWWGGGLKEVDPGWAEGGLLKWELGGSSTILDIKPKESVRISGSLMDTEWHFISTRKNLTTVKFTEGDPKSGAFFTDGGSKHRSDLTSSLEKLKQNIESSSPDLSISLWNPPSLVDEEEYARRCLTQEFEEVEETRTFREHSSFETILDPYNREDFNAAIKAAKQVIPNFADFDLVYKWLADAYRATGRLEQAHEVLSEGLGKAKRKSLLLTDMGEVEWRRGELQNAVYAWSQALSILALKPIDYNAYLLVSYVAQGLNLSGVSSSFLSRVDELQPGRVRMPENEAAKLMSLARTNQSKGIERVVKGLGDKYLPGKSLGMAHHEERSNPARVMHYVHWICMVFLIVSGFYIHRPFAPGLMGTMRVIHFIAMYAVGLNLLVRIYWAIFGKDRDIRHFVFEKQNKGKLLSILTYYLFINKLHPDTAKYNTLQKSTYNFWAFLLVVQGVTGLSLYWPNACFFPDLNDAIGGLYNMRMAHYLIMWIFIITTVIHIYLSLAEDFGQFRDMFFGVRTESE